MLRRIRWIAGLLALGCAGGSPSASPAGGASEARHPAGNTYGAPSVRETPPDGSVPTWVAAKVPSLRLSSTEHFVGMGAGPHVVIDRERVFIDGDEVARVAEIAAQGRLQKVDGVFETMKTIRDREKNQRPDVPYHGEVTYWIDNRVLAVVVKSVFQTAAYAGSPRGHFAVRRPNGSGFARVPVNAYVPGPDPGMGVSSPGRLPPEVIQGVVRRSYRDVLKCYEQGLSRNAALTGRVQVRFVIGRDGSVTSSSLVDSTISDAAMVSCVVEHFRHLKFPAPSGGIVTVVYPLLFEPDKQD